MTRKHPILEELGRRMAGQRIDAPAGARQAGWRTVVLADVVAPDGLQTGPYGSQLKASEYTPEGVPIVMPRDMRAGKIDTSEIARVPPAIASERLAKHRVDAGDILFGRRGDIGRCALVAREQSGWLCGTGCLRARLDGTVEPAFLIHYLTWSPVKSWLTDHAVGQTMLNLNTEIIARLPLTVPPLGEQRKIAAILASVDGTIEKTGDVIAQLQVVREAMAQELLARGLPGRHTRFQPSPLGIIPESWKVVSYGEIMEEVHERAGDRRPPVLSVTKARGPMLASERFSRALHSGDLSSYRLAPRDHIVCDPMLLWDGAIGRQTVVELGLVSPDYRVYRPRANVTPAFLGVLVRSPSMKARYAAGARGTNVRRNRIARPDFLAIPALLPPLDEQEKIVAHVTALDETIAAEQRTLEQLEDTRQALLSVLLTGEVRVTPGEDTP